MRLVDQVMTSLADGNEIPHCLPSAEPLIGAVVDMEFHPGAASLAAPVVKVKAFLALDTPDRTGDVFLIILIVHSSTLSRKRQRGDVKDTVMAHGVGVSIIDTTPGVHEP